MTRKRAKYKEIILISFILNTFPGLAYSQQDNNINVIENKTLNISPGKKTKIKLENVTNYIISNPDIAKVEIVNDEITITGLSLTGTTTVFFRQKNNPSLIPYTIVSDYSVEIAEAEKKLTRPIVYKTDRNLSTGLYSIDLNFINSNLKDVNYQTASHFLSYTIPSEYGNLGLRGSFLNRFANLNSVENISLTNAELSYINRDFDVRLGSVVTKDPFLLHTSYPIDALYPFNNNIRGLNFSGKGEKFNYSVYTGIHRNDFTFYDGQAISILKKNNAEVSSDLYNLGAMSQFILPYKNLSVFAVANSNFEIDGKKNKYLNLISGFNVDPINNLNINGSIGTNLSTLSFYLNSMYTYSWANDNKNNNTDLIRLTGTVKSIGKGYNNNQESINDYILATNISHRSGFNISGSYAISTLNNSINSDSINFSITKNLFGELINAYSSINFSSYKNPKQDNKMYQFGANINYYLPLNLNYSLFQRNAVTGSIDQHQIRGSLRLFKNNFADLNINSYYNKNIYSNVSTSLVGVYLGSVLKIFDNISLNGTLGYVSDFGADNNKIRTDSISLNSRLGWNINRKNTVYLSIGYNNRFLPENNVYDINSALNYVYNFGASYEEAKGTIKGYVFDDTNDNGTLDKEENIIPGVKIKIKEMENMSTVNGFSFKDLNYGPYDVVIDEENLPKGYRLTSPANLPVYLDSDSSEVNFAISTQGVIKGIVYKNKYHSNSLEGIEITLDNNEKIVTGDNGLFIFKTHSGKHTLRIDPRKIPLGYTLSDKLVKEIDLDKEANVSFTFNPVITFTANVYTNKGMPASDVKFKVKYENDDESKEETIITDKSGTFTLRDLNEGTIQISAPELKEPIEIDIPSNPEQIQKNIILK